MIIRPFALIALLAVWPLSGQVEVRNAMKRMTLREKVGQLIMVAYYGENPSNRHREYRDYARLISQSKVGGLILLNRVHSGMVRQADALSVATFLNRMQSLATYPLLIGGDFERGSSMRVANTTKYPHAMAYGAANDLEATRKTGAATASEARALGVHWLFAPVADVNSNPDNPIINTRSYGERPELVAAHVKAFVEGAHEARRNGVLVTVKHFPGQGDAAVDTHLGLATVKKMELLPFKSAISAGVDGVMAGHLAVPEIESREIPATVSEKLISGLLRTELGFGGLVVTDAMDMQGLTRQFSAGEAAVRAIEAGVDVLLVPARPEAAIRAVIEAVQTGRISLARIHSSLQKVLAAKQRLGLFQKRLVQLDKIKEQIDSPQAALLAQSVAEKALTVIKADQDILPLRNPETACLVAMSENRQSSSGKRMIEDALTRAPRMRTYWLDPTLGAEELSATARQLGDCSTVVIGAFVGLPELYEQFIQQVTAVNGRVVLCALGSPYLLRKGSAVAAQVATFSSTITSEAALIRGLFGEVPMQAKSPVTITAF